jgi:hypothetical protein
MQMSDVTRESIIQYTSIIIKHHRCIHASIIADTCMLCTGWLHDDVEDS